MTMTDDIDAFYDLFGFTRQARPTPLHALPDRLGVERLRHLKEELGELTLAVTTGDLTSQADALADLVYVAMGTAWLMGLPWDDVWAAVHEANMRRVRGTGPKRVEKPAGWIDPRGRIDAVLAVLRDAA